MPYGSAFFDTLTSSGNLAINGNVTISGNDTANTYNLVSQTLGTATAGRLEYNGIAPFFTPAGTQRGIVPGMQYYRLNSDLVGLNATGNQKILGVGVTLSSNTVYAFESFSVLYKSAGTTSHTVGINWATTGTGSFNSAYTVQYVSDGSLVNSPVYGNRNASFGNVVLTSAITTAIHLVTLVQKGTINVTTGGIFTPQYYLSAAPGGAYSTLEGSYMSIYPIGVAGANVNVGSWA